LTLIRILFGCLFVGMASTACAALGEQAPEPIAPTVAGALTTSNELTDKLDRLTIADPGPMTGYTRDRFGQPWRDTDGNGCDQRSDVLIRDADSVRVDSRHSCRVIAIVLLDPYTGKRLDRTRDIQIDHVVPLAAAWRAGASQWSDAARERFATDETNLLAVDGPTNERKGDKTPDQWKPPSEGVWCLYAKIYVATSDSYRLSITAATHDALASMLARCRQ
jgi:hypothetical protein